MPTDFGDFSFYLLVFKVSKIPWFWKIRRKENNAAVNSFLSSQGSPRPLRFSTVLEWGSFPLPLPLSYMLLSPIHIRARLHVNVSETKAIKILSKWAGHLYVIISKYGFEQKRFHRNKPGLYKQTNWSKLKHNFL